MANGSRWLDGLSDEDLVFLKRFVLASGSLKALGKVYGVSYPTIRLRVDRLIEKVKLLDEHRHVDAFERRLRLLHTEGRIDMVALKGLLSAHRDATGQGNENPGSSY